MDNFVKDLALIEERVSDEDLLDFSSQTESFSKKIDGFSFSGLIGLIAEFGKGKSTLIRQVQNSRGERNEKWIEFEAWKLPERKELWEGFVLELARQIDESSFKEAREKIDGEQNQDKQTLINTIGDIPGLAAIKNLNHFFRTSPARRVFEIQEILSDLITEKVEEGTLVVVAEDVDRSGPNGIYFLETLKQFVKSLDSGKKLIVIVPIAESSFLDNQESYLKCLDVVDFLDTSSTSLRTFFEGILSEDIVQSKSHQVEQVSTFFEHLVKKHPETTLRKIKLVLRKSYINYRHLAEEGYEPDWRMCIIFETMKYFKDDESGLSHFEQARGRNRIYAGTLYASWLTAIYLEANNSPANATLSGREGEVRESTCDYTSTTRPNNSPEEVQKRPSNVWFPRHQFPEEGENEKGYFADFYFKY